MAKYRYIDSAGNEAFTESNEDLTKTAGGANFTLVPGSNTPTTTTNATPSYQPYQLGVPGYGGPTSHSQGGQTFYDANNFNLNPTKLQPGDVLMGNNFQTPIMQELLGQNLLENYFDASGKSVGYQMKGTYTAPGTKFTPSGLNSFSQTYQDLYDTQNKALEESFNQLKSDYESQYASKKQGARDVGGRTSGLLKRILGRAGGFTTTAGAQAMVTQENTIQNQLQELDSEKERVIGAARGAMMSGKSANFKALTDQLMEIEKMRYQRSQDEISNFLNFMQEQRASEQMNLSTINTLSNIPEGKTITVNGKTYTGLKPEVVEPFFNATNLISLMKEVPEGTTQDITDPNTGTVYTLTGFKDADIYTATNDAGTVTGIDKNTGEVLWKVQGVGNQQGGSGGGGTAKQGNYPKGIWSAIESGVSSLQKGEQWGTVWNRIKAQFPDVSNEEIDKFLGGSGGSAGMTYTGSQLGTPVTTGATSPTGWAAPDAFEDFKAKQYKETTTQWQLTAEINKEVGKLETAGADRESIKSYIRAQGGNPYDFGY